MHDEAARSVAMTEHAVVIAGGGPTGLMLAAELALSRVDVAIVERRASQDLAGTTTGSRCGRTTSSAYSPPGSTSWRCRSIADVK
jgi:ribulose 1,5-bisphosphate synthetase/thiazole synthase